MPISRDPKGSAEKRSRANVDTEAKRLPRRHPPPPAAGLEGPGRERPAAPPSASAEIVVA